MKTAAFLLVAVTLSTSLFLLSSAAPDPLLGTGLGNVIKGLGDTAKSTATSVGSFVEGTIGTLVGVKTCSAYVLFLKDLSVVLLAAEERLYELLTDVTKKLDKDIANASGALKELLIKLNAPLKVLLEGLPELLKALVAAVVIPTEGNLNKVEAGLQQLEQIVAELKELLAGNKAGILPFGYKGTMIAISNSVQDADGAITAVVKSLRRNKGD